jgi:hypothetical protein
MPDLITPSQRKRMFALVGELGWDDDMRRDMTHRWVGKRSWSLDADPPMTSAEAADVITHLARALGRQHHARDQQALDRARQWPLADDAQGRYIDTLVAHVFHQGIDGFRAWLSTQPWCGWDIVPRLERPSDIRDYIIDGDSSVVDPDTGEVVQVTDAGTSIISRKLIPSLEGMARSYNIDLDRLRRSRRRPPRDSRRPCSIR